MILKRIQPNGRLISFDIDDEAIAGAYADEIKNDTLDLSFLTATPSEENCIGMYTETFTVSTPAGMNPKKINFIMVEVGMHEGVSSQSQSYTVENRFAIRNDLFVVE